MNILFFLTPKTNVAYVYDDNTVRQALEKIDHYGYTAIPIISRDGKFVGVLTEGDLLRAIKREQIFSIKETEEVIVSQIERRTNIHAVSAIVDIEDLIETALNQNFVPVVDDFGSFIGIVTRREIMRYLLDRINNNTDSAEPARKQYSVVSA